MANGIRTGGPCGFNKGRSSKFLEGPRVRHTLEDGRRTYRPKRCRNKNKDEDDSPKTLNDKNHQASSQKCFFPMNICPKVNVIARLELELAYFEASVQHISHRGYPLIKIFSCIQN